MTRSMPVDQARQLVINAMDVDRARRTGVKGTQHRIAFDTGAHLTRYCYCLMRNSLLIHVIAETLYHLSCMNRIPTGSISGHHLQRRSNELPSIPLESMRDGPAMVMIN